MALPSKLHLALTLQLAGCGPAFYQYRAANRTDLLVPPRFAKADPAKPVVLQLAKSPCTISTPTISLGAKGRLTVVPIAAEDSTRLKDFQQFRNELNDCLPAPAATELLQRIVHNLPLSTTLLHRLAYGGFASNSLLELRAPIFLRYVYPAPGNKVETARFRAEPSGAFTRIEGAPSKLDDFLARYKQFRLLFLTSNSAQDHKELLVGGASRPELKAATGNCTEKGTAFGCFPLEKGAIIAAELSITVDGQQQYVWLDARAGEATRAPITGITRGPLATRVKWTPPADPGKLMLLGGERITTHN